MDGSVFFPTKLSTSDSSNRRRQRLINEFQRDLPLSRRPFQDMAEQLDWNESAVIGSLLHFTETGVVSRVGPVIRPNTIGVSALAAMAVPAHRLAEVAARVTRRPEVNHNYEREHHFNLWFVVTAANDAHLDIVLRKVERETGLPVMVLPMLDDYYIDLGFDLEGGGKSRYSDAVVDTNAVHSTDRRLLLAIQDGLPLVSRPYDSVGVAVGISGSEVRERLARLLDAGVVKRLGVIVRHHECGYRHNAMVVWDVPDAIVHNKGRFLASTDAVRLCYRRPRRLPGWPYNLFCMIHGRDRETVLSEIGRITAYAGLDPYPRDVLFSTRRFKQRGARYDARAPMSENVS